MIPGWVTVEEWQKNRNWDGLNVYKEWHFGPTDKQRCPDCQFVTNVNDPMGIHVCPELKDGYDTKFTIGDEVYFFADQRIRRGVVTKWNQKTEKLSIRENNEDGTNHVLNRLGKVLRIDEQG